MHSGDLNTERVLINLSDEQITEILSNYDETAIQEWLFFVEQSATSFTEQIQHINHYLSEETDPSPAKDFIIEAMVLRLVFVMEMFVEYQRLILIFKAFLDKNCEAEYRQNY